MTWKTKDKQAHLEKLLWCRPVLRNLLEARIYEVSEIVRPVERGKHPPEWPALRHSCLSAVRSADEESHRPTAPYNPPTAPTASSGPFLGPQNHRTLWLKNVKTWDNSRAAEALHANRHPLTAVWAAPCQIPSCTNSSRPTAATDSFSLLPPPTQFPTMGFCYLLFSVIWRKKNAWNEPNVLSSTRVWNGLTRKPLK